jgi:hypothetical protein
MTGIGTQESKAEVRAKIHENSPDHSGGRRLGSWDAQQ